MAGSEQLLKRFLFELREPLSASDGFGRVMLLDSFSRTQAAVKWIFGDGCFSFWSRLTNEKERLFSLIGDG
jgi:hypothetical protein